MPSCRLSSPQSTRAVHTRLYLQHEASPAGLAIGTVVANPRAQEATMHRTRLFVSLASAAFVVTLGAQAAIAQDGPASPGASPAQGSQRPPSPSAPTSPSPSSGALGSSQSATTAMGELTDVDAKNKTITLKTATGTEMKFRYEDSTKVAGAQKG